MTPDVKDFIEACEVEIFEGAVAEMLMASFFGWRLA
jgi:hypothetical protein